jgi:transcriptional regulator with XRE-family HTH domain
MSEMTEPQPVEAYRPSELVGLNVRKWRERRNWSQQRLVDRLDELLTESPPWAEDLWRARQEDPSRPKDSRERKPGVKKASSTWNQAKIARLEAGKLRKVRLEDVFELALALDVSPLYLMAAGQGEDGRQLRVFLAPTIVRWPQEVRQWIRGVKPLLPSGAYKDNDDAVVGRRFYLIDSQGLGEWRLIEDAARYGKRVRQSLRLLVPNGEEGQADGE